jgi:hypothetical protein
VPRHVAYVGPKGLPTPWGVRRQRRILASLCERYRPLHETDGGGSATRFRPARGFGFSLRTSPDDAGAKLVALLDDIDPDWRSFLKVRDVTLRA